MVSHLARGLRDRGYRVLVGLFRSGWLKEQCEAKQLETVVTPMQDKLDWRWLKKVLHFVRAENVSLIHTHEFTANVYGALVARLAGIPVVATVHGKNYYWENARRRIAYRRLAKWGRMVAVSRDIREFLAEHVGIKKERIEVIHNGINVDAFDCQHEATAHKSALGLCGDGRIIGMIGSLYPVKGHRYLLGALPRILAACPDTTVLLIGRGELDSSLKALAKDLGVDQRVHLLGLRSDISALLSIMDVFVQPSISEGLSIALLEAMAAAKPVVASHVGGNPELVSDGETGCLVPPQDENALATTIVSLLQNPQMARILGENGRRRVCADFTLDRMIDKYVTLYENSIANHASS